MDKLWAPWRIKYIAGKKKKNCIFCAEKKNRNSNTVVFKTKHSVCLLNTYPYNNGHLMVCPLRHINDFTKLTPAEVMDIFNALKKAKFMLDKVLRAQGYNIGFNLSQVAGAGFAGHLHIHIVPRWKGDTNFMPVVSDTRVISQSLEHLLKLLKKNSSNAD